MDPVLGWNVIDDLRQVLSYPFMVNALRAGTVVAVVAAAAGYVMVQRRQAFAGHTLAMIGFPGAAGATWLGVNPLFGYFTFCLAGAGAIASVPGSAGSATDRRGESAVIGVVQSFALASGFLFVNLYHGFQAGLTSLLFGSIIGITDEQVVLLVAGGALCLAILAVLGRPLLFASVDPATAGARGVPVRAVGVAFLATLGLAAAATSQVTGSLLVFALLVAPAATAVKLTARPGLGVVLAVLIGLAVTWLGECVAFFSPYPIGFWVTTFAFGGYLMASGWRAVSDRVGARRTC
jgi:zinc/manganese transport system permease protein